jgi:hypothetical protein
MRRILPEVHGLWLICGLLIRPLWFIMRVPEALPSKEADLCNDNPTATPPQYKLLASWPVPPQGDAYFTKYGGQVVRFHVTATAYHVDTSLGRAYIGSYPINTD